MNANFDPIGVKTRLSLREAAARATSLQPRWLFGATKSQALATALTGTFLPEAENLRRKTVILRMVSQVSCALALLELDGIAGQIILCPPDIDAGDLSVIAASLGADWVITDQTAGEPSVAELPSQTLAQTPLARPLPFAGGVDTKWLLFTSGTAGAPKLVAHNFGGLTGAIQPMAPSQKIVWGTFYDMRRYGGLQMLLRALLSGGSMVFSDPSEAVAEFLIRLGRHQVTHLAGTPTHWRRALMSPELRQLHPHYLRLSGEIADRGVLEALKAVFPNVPIGHAYASTEAGVGFEVTDGLEGFPAAFLQRTSPVEMKVLDGTLRVRSQRTASHYIGAGAVTEADGFVDTGDLVEARGDRLYFLGRASGIINVGGLKVHPEEVEAVLNAVPGVRLSRVKARKSPIMGAIVVADIVASDPAQAGPALKAVIAGAARAALAAYKVPSMVQFVTHLPMTAGGKLERKNA